MCVCPGVVVVANDGMKDYTLPLSHAGEASDGTNQKAGEEDVSR